MALVTCFNPQLKHFWGFRVKRCWVELNIYYINNQLSWYNLICSSSACRSTYFLKSRVGKRAHAQEKTQTNILQPAFPVSANCENSGGKATLTLLSMSLLACERVTLPFSLLSNNIILCFIFFYLLYFFGHKSSAAKVSEQWLTVAVRCAKTQLCINFRNVTCSADNERFPGGSCSCLFSSRSKVIQVWILNVLVRAGSKSPERFVGFGR